MAFTTTQVVAFTAQLILTCSVSLLTHASIQDGKYAYNTLTIPLYAAGAFAASLHALPSYLALALPSSA